MPERSQDTYPQTALDADRCVIHPSAMVAPSARLEAVAPHCIRVGAGVVISDGCLLQACSGDITIESGTVLGTGVLIVGWSAIGAFAVLGTSSTLFEVNVSARDVLAAHSIRGLPDRQVFLEKPLPQIADEVDNLPDPWTGDRVYSPTDNAPGDASSAAQPEPTSSADGYCADQLSPVDQLPPTEGDRATETHPTPSREPDADAIPKSATVYGRQHVNQIIDSILQRKAPSASN